MDARARAISEAIRFYRAERDWTQERLAEEAGIAATSVVRLENGGIARPRVSTLKKLADALGIDAHELTSFVAHPSVELPNDAPVETSVPFTAVYERDGDWWIGYVEELPGANAQERTLDEARQSLREAVRDILEANRELTRTEFEGHDVVREHLSA
jgi:transcriptional regulator with XRE-family HTH domain